MNIISISRASSFEIQSRPAFGAKPKLSQEKIIKGISGDLLSNLTTKGDSFELTNILGDKKKSKVFFATLGSLITATAIKITELITGESAEAEENKEVTLRNFNKKEGVATLNNKQAKKHTSLETKEENDNKNTNAIEQTELIKFIKHKGKASEKENALILSINNATNRLNLDVEHQNSLISLFNKFCGLNNKGVSYTPKNKELTNSSIAGLLSARLEQCKDLADIELVISRYNLYTNENENIATSEQPKDEIKQDNISVPDCVMQKSKIKNAYKNLDADERKQVDKFLDDIKNDENCQVYQKTAIQGINKYYSDVLPEISLVYNTMSNNQNDNKEQFLALISNRLISTDAIKNYSNDSIAKSFNFLEYNSMIYNKLPQNSIEELAKLRNRGAISEIIMSYTDNSYDIKLHNVYLGKSFKTIVETFKAINSNSSRGLYVQDKEYTTNDIDIEIQNNNYSYPLLKKYLTVNNQYLNQGKEQKLLEIYNGADINKDLFTIHSYLRFLERYVMPELESSSENELYASKIRTSFCNKLVLLKNSIVTAMRSPIRIYEYSIDDTGIKAPKLKVPYDKDGNYFEITINDNGKIHTIF